MGNPLVSVVVPIYNVEKTLSKCVDSILNQTYPNLEIILVDDGSPDNCPTICDEYALSDKRIKVIHKENEGLGFARNTGIEKATGKYICFFDSDDYIDPKTIEETLLVAEETSADLTYFGHIEETTRGELIVERLPETPKEIYEGSEIKEELMPMALSYNAATGESWGLFLSAWNGLFSMETIEKNGWRFVSEREVISEDIYSVLEYYSYCKKIAFIKKSFYHYVSNFSSLSKAYRADRFERLKVFSEKLIELSQKLKQEEKLREGIKTTFLGLTISAFKQIVASDLCFSAKIEEIRTILCDEYMKKIFRGYNFGGEGLYKKIFLICVKNKLSLFTYYITIIKLSGEKR